ncbi:MAG: mechanosensitive ion channel [Proteobacteria bacterium]|nr:mechanosensitive ion channel [Pseudomonadota bacterium]
MIGERWFVQLATAVIVIAVIVAIARLLQRGVSRRLESGATAYRVRKFISFTAFLAAILVLLSAYSDRLAGLTVALGVAGAGIAFALQEVIASVAGWVAVAFGRFYSTGDRVQLGGIKGDVIDIGVLRTTLMEVGQWVDGDLYNGRIVRVANSFVFKEPVFNYSADYPFLWDEIKVPIRYGSDWQYATSVLEQVLEDVCGDFARRSEAAWSHARERYALEDARIKPLVTMVANDNWIELTARYVVDYRQRRVTKDKLFRQFLTAVDASKDRIRMASATFEVVNLPRLNLKMGDVTGSAESHYVP